jgi:predicted nucleotidyltransferase
MVRPNAEFYEQTARLIGEEIDPERIYLFGSRASGRNRPNSDLDLLVIEREPFGPNRNRYEEIDRLQQILAPLGVAADVLVYSVEEEAKWRKTTNHVVARAIREGRLLYERS